MKLSLLLITSFFLANASFAEDLSCPTPEESQVPELMNAIIQKYTAETVDPEFCRQMAQCYNGTSEVSSTELYCEDPDTNTYMQAYLSAKQGNCNLARQERLALQNYMGGLYSCLNRSLYTGNGSKFPVLIESVNNALKRFPRYEGFVFRGSVLPKNVIDQHAVGQIVTYPAFTSTSTARSTAEGFSGGAQEFLIYSKNGRPVMGLYQGENEVLFTSDTRFKVLHRDDNRFIMREVAENESESAARAEDERVLGLARAATNNTTDKYLGDVWHCPLDPNMTPASLEQKTVPNTSGFISQPAQKSTQSQSR